MWKSLSLAAGVFSCLVGLELLVIDSASLKPINGSGEVRVITAPDWAPWALISAGAVTLLHFGTGAGGGASRAAGAPKPSLGKYHPE